MGNVMKQESKDRSSRMTETSDNILKKFKVSPKIIDQSLNNDVEI